MITVLFNLFFFSKGFFFPDLVQLLEMGAGERASICWFTPQIAANSWSCVEQLEFKPAVQHSTGPSNLILNNLFQEDLMGLCHVLAPPKWLVAWVGHWPEKSACDS